jgi:hypothetical protein
MEAMELSSLDGFKKGDITVISDPITQEEFGSERVKFCIKSVRTYANTKEDIKYICYVLGSSDEEENEFFLLVVKEVGGFYDLMLYYIDNEGPLDAKEGEKGVKTPDYGNVVDAEHKDFVDVIIIAHNEATGVREIQWNRKEDAHMDLSYYDDKGRGTASLCEFFTDDENFGNDLALVTCKGDLSGGYIEMWYGYALQNHEVELFPKGTEL